MARGRNRQKCRKCPQPEQAAAITRQAADKAQAKLTDAKLEPRIIYIEGEGERLWRHVLFGTGTCIGMLAGYAALNVPGNPLPQLYALANQLNSVIQQVEQSHGNKRPRDDAPND